MKCIFILVLALMVCQQTASAQEVRRNLFRPDPPNYQVARAVEIESLIPMFFYGGYHVGVGYRIRQFRIRISVINGGDFDAEPHGISNSSPEYKRFYKTSPGIFFGYNVWKNLELYGYVENHTFEIEQVSSGERQDLHSVDSGIGISYQFFIGRTFYIQPGFHSYFRSQKELTFSNESMYKISGTDLSFVVRVGARLWRRY